MGTNNLELDVFKARFPVRFKSSRYAVLLNLENGSQEELVVQATDRISKEITTGSIESDPEAGVQSILADVVVKSSEPDILIGVADFWNFFRSLEKIGPRIYMIRTTVGDIICGRSQIDAIGNVPISKFTVNTVHGSNLGPVVLGPVVNTSDNVKPAATAPATVIEQKALKHTSKRVKRKAAVALAKVLGCPRITAAPSRAYGTARTSVASPVKSSGRIAESGPSTAISKTGASEAGNIMELDNHPQFTYIPRATFPAGECCGRTSRNGVRPSKCHTIDGTVQKGTSDGCPDRDTDRRYRGPDIGTDIQPNTGMTGPGPPDDHTNRCARRSSRSSVERMPCVGRAWPGWAVVHHDRCKRSIVQ